MTRSEEIPLPAKNRPGCRLLPAAALAVLPIIATAVIGGLLTRPSIASWYGGLAKPWFTPPNWLFGPAWTLLYLLMAIAIFRILRAPQLAPGRALAITLFFMQLGLNATWSPAFFTLQSPLAGLVVILPLLLAILLTIKAFWPVDRIAAALLAPYALWVSFATLLNIAIFRLN